MQRANENIAESSQQVKSEQRERIELLRRRIELLSGQDRVLMTMYLEKGISFRQMAVLSGMNEANIARRIQKLTKRLLDGEYIRCLRNREKLTKEELEIARYYFVQGLSQRRIAGKLGCGVFKVRSSVNKIQWFVNRSKRQRR